MDPEEYEKRPYHLSGYLLTARITGTLVAGILLFFAIGVFVDAARHDNLPKLIASLGEMLFMTITLTLAFIGLVLAYWKEGLGGAISFVSLAVLFIASGDFHLNVILTVFFALMPGFLYMLYWWLVFRYHRKQRYPE